MANKDPPRPRRPQTDQPAQRKPAAPANASGNVVHDSRGNAVWDWLKQTGSHAIESTSRLLKKLEVPDLKLDDAPNAPPPGGTERDPGGGYDPYNQATKPPKPRGPGKK
jgi:hypothetical protein